MRDLFYPITSTILMVLVILLFFRTTEQRKTIEGLNERINLLTQVQVGDTISVFETLSMDSVQVTFDPRSPAREGLLAVFTTWCSACKQNMPQWNLLAQEIPTDQVNLFGVTPDSLWRVKRYQKETPIGFPVHSVAHNFKIMKKNKFLAFPTLVLVDSLCVVRRIWNGIVNDEQRREIVRYLEERSSL